MAEILRVNTLHKHYGDHHVVKGISFVLEKGDIGCLLGPSGCGKTTLLRCIAGFEPLTSGSISVDGREVSGRNYVAPERRRMGMVFQDNALFPHLTVAGNVAFGLKHRTRADKRNIVRNLLNTVGLAEKEGKYPHELSGGQQQRVALARALAPEPQLILLDEPFSNLDVELRESLSVEIRTILKRFSITALLVTHNQTEAFAMADRVGVISDGVMEQWDTPYGIYHRPATAAVAKFVGEGVLIHGTPSGNGTVSCALGKLKVDSGLPKEKQLKVLVRPEDIMIDEAGALQAVIADKQFRGPNILYTLKLASGEKLLVLVQSHETHALGEKIRFRLEMDDVVLFPDPDDFDDTAAQLGVDE
ncbi:MAG: ABC transporter ATP-binding protein [Nitrospinaceae bacterium]|nr:MAG: ABC transporter ATP-binding protein [Nitrospinaceae bacterium]